MKSRLRTNKKAQSHLGTMPSDDFNLSWLCCSHRGPLICSLRGKFDSTKMDTAIQLGALPCGCWVVLDGNNRVALILKNNASATMAALPKERLLVFRDGEWDRSLQEWWNPNPQPFDFVREYSAVFYRVQRNKRRFESVAHYEAEIKRLRNILEHTPHQCKGACG